MTLPTVPRDLVWAVPLGVLAVGLLARRPGPRMSGAALLALLYATPMIFLASLLGVRAGWWTFGEAPLAFYGVPVDLWLGWAVLWGPAAFLLAPRAPLAGVVATAILLDLGVMPHLTPYVALSPTWGAGEVLVSVGALLPAQALARWTAERRHLRGRVALQFLAFLTGFLGLLPLVVSSFGRGDPHLPGPIALQGLALAGLPGLAGLLEFARVGGGTPVPFDPPMRLVRTGPYAYMRNPMQLSSALVFGGLGLAWGDALVATMGAMAVVFGAGVAMYSEDHDLTARFGPAWTDYRAAVRSWWPRWRPFVAAPCTLYVAEDCGPCRSMADWLRDREPVGLRIVAAEDHPRRELWRVTWESPDGAVDEGIAAVARALEHLNLGWAMLGFLLRLPFVTPLVQLLADASGPGPRRVRRRTR